MAWWTITSPKAWNLHELSGENKMLTPEYLFMTMTCGRFPSVFLLMIAVDDDFRVIGNDVGSYRLKEKET